MICYVYLYKHNDNSFNSIHSDSVELCLKNRKYKFQ